MMIVEASALGFKDTLDNKNRNPDIYFGPNFAYVIKYADLPVERSSIRVPDGDAPIPGPNLVGPCCGHSTYLLGSVFKCVYPSVQVQ